jgi:hypothetical protein
VVEVEEKDFRDMLSGARCANAFISREFDHYVSIKVPLSTIESLPFLWRLPDIPSFVSNPTTSGTSWHVLECAIEGFRLVAGFVERLYTQLSLSLIADSSPAYNKRTDRVENTVRLL